MITYNFAKLANGATFFCRSNIEEWRRWAAGEGPTPDEAPRVGGPSGVSPRPDNRHTAQLQVLTDEEWTQRVREVVANPGGVVLPRVGPGEAGTKEGTEAEVLRRACAYWDLVEGHKEMSIEVTLQACDAGDDLLSCAGHYVRAVCALRQVWHERHGTHLGGCFEPQLDKLLEAPLVRYLRHQVAYGARTRFQGPPQRVQAKPHPSAVGYMEEFLEKVWTDTVAGRVLRASADHP